MNPNTSSTAALAGAAKWANWDCKLTAGLVKLGQRCVERVRQPHHLGNVFADESPGRELVGGMAVWNCSTFGIRNLNDLTTDYIPQTREWRQVRFLGVCVPDLGWEQSGGESVTAVAGVVGRLWARRSAGARPGRTVESVSWGGCEGRHKGEERVKRSEERVRQLCLSGTVSGTGGTWSGWTPSIGHRLRISTPGRRGMLLGGALRGRSPRTREGRIGPTAQNCSGQWSEKTPTLPETGTGTDRGLAAIKRYARVCPHLGCASWVACVSVFGAGEGRHKVCRYGCEREGGWFT